MITFEVIQNTEFESLINKFDAQINNLRKQYNIELKHYGNFLRLGLNTIKTESFDNLLERLEVNRELERALDNAGGYTLEFLGANNPKLVLMEIIRIAKNKALKSNQLFNYLETTCAKQCVVTENNDIDFLKSLINKQNISIVSHKDIKKKAIENRTLIFYSFNGTKDFDYLYNLSSNIILILFDQEYQLFQKQLLKRKQLIEEEVTSIDRLKLCGIQYDVIPDIPIHISQTIEDIVDRIDDFGNRAYNGYKEESDSLLDELEDIVYKISFVNSKPGLIKGSETVFDKNGALVRVSKIQIGDKIRIYPLEQFADNLYQVAVETEPEVFGKVEEHSKLWINAIKELNRKYTSETLYHKLKYLGLRVKPATVDSYDKGNRKFPMFNSDLRAIISLFYYVKNKEEIDELIKPILKSKTTYNSTMIALGRGLKQELKLFLHKNIIGEILEKRNFTSFTLQKFINEFMPLLTVTGKEIYNDESGQLELNLIQQLEL